MKQKIGISELCLDNRFCLTGVIFAASFLLAGAAAEASTQSVAVEVSIPPESLGCTNRWSRTPVDVYVFDELVGTLFATNSTGGYAVGKKIFRLKDTGKIEMSIRADGFPVKTKEPFVVQGKRASIDFELDRSRQIIVEILRSSSEREVEEVRRRLRRTGKVIETKVITSGRGHPVGEPEILSLRTGQFDKCESAEEEAKHLSKRFSFKATVLVEFPHE